MFAVDFVQTGGSANDSRPPPANPCDSNPCKNGGGCSDNNGGFQCSCLSDFTGVQCEQPVSEYQLYFFNLDLVSRVLFSSFLLYPK